MNTWGSNVSVYDINWLGYENTYCNIFFLQITESKITTGHNFILVTEPIRLDFRTFSFSQRTINVWNKLSTDCVHASNVNNNVQYQNRRLL